MKRSRPPRRTEAEREQMEAFKLAVQFDPCAGCGRWFGYRTWLHQKAHHVVYQQHLPAGMEWDERNAMSVCDDCHERHHNASRRIPLSALTEQNLEFANEVLGDAAEYYLARRYAPSPQATPGEGHDKGNDGATAPGFSGLWCGCRGRRGGA